MATIRQAFSEAVERGELLNCKIIFLVLLCFSVLFIQAFNKLNDWRDYKSIALDAESEKKIVFNTKVILYKIFL